ncbi:MAG TPA: hypothetical protein VIY10_21870 [Solirubrobacteraceae bacterium]
MSRRVDRGDRGTRDAIRSAGPRQSGANAPAWADAVLRLQRSAGNKAVNRAFAGRPTLMRRVIADVRTNDVGQYFADQLTADELQDQVALIADTLEHGNPEPAARQTMEQNLEFLEGYGEAHGTALPGATAHDFRVAIASHGADVQRYLALLKQLIPDGGPSEWGFKSRLDWQADQMTWIVEATGRARQLVDEAQAGGDSSAQKFDEAGTELTAAIFGLRVLATILMYDDFQHEVETQYGSYDLPRRGSEMVHRILDPVLAQLRLRAKQTVDEGVAFMLSPDGSFAFDFSSMKDDVEDQIKASHRLAQWINIAMLAFTAFDILMLPVAGAGGNGGGAPRFGGFGGAGGAGAVAVTTVLTDVESLAALKRLVAIGALTAPELVKTLGGRAGEIQGTPKPIETSPKGGPPGKSGGSTGGEKAPASVTPDPEARLAPGLPTAAEDAVVQRYTEALAELRERSAVYRNMEPKSGEAPAKFKERYDRARTAVESAKRELKAIEDEAVGPKGGELPTHLDPLVKAREALERGGPAATTAGTRVACDAVRAAPKNIRGMDFADIEKAMGRPPDEVVVASKPAGGGVATGGQRLSWKFKDGSRLVVDAPRPLGGRPTSADLPHAELHGPKGERLDQQGIEVPEASISAHMTITDNLAHLENHFSPARKGR